MKYLWTLGFLLIFGACEKEVLIEKQYSWKQLNDFLYTDQIQTNGFATKDNLFFMGTNIFTEVVSNEDSTDFMTTRSYFGFEYPIGTKLPISSRIFVGYNTTGVGFYSTRNPAMGGTKQWIYIPDFDTTFSGFRFPSYWNSEAMVINNKNQCLIPYSFYSKSGSSIAVDLETKFIVANLELKELYGPGEDYVDTLSCHRLEYNGSLGHTTALHTFGDYFIATGTSSTIKISSDLKCMEIYKGSLSKIIQINKTLYAFTEDNMFLISNDNGESWQQIMQVGSDFKKLSYCMIQDKLIGYFNSQIFAISLSEKEITIDEIENDGLEGKTITSVNLFKGQIFVSTLSGVCQKSIGSFYKYKEK